MPIKVVTNLQSLLSLYCFFFFSNVADRGNRVTVDDDNVV